MNKLAIVFFLLFGIQLYSQNSRNFRKLGCAEKRWVIFHPFIAKKAYRISIKTVAISESDSIMKILGRDQNGGAVDAFRHAFWMAQLTQKIGRKKAIKLGRAHEKKNKADFKKKRLEEGLIPDKASMCMDLYNNIQGANIVRVGSCLNDKQLIELVINLLKDGRLKLIKKNNKLQSVDKDGKVIPLNHWQGKWENERVLIPSGLLY